jgi:hypothetical protein
MLLGSPLLAESTMTPDQLDNLVAPVALYPDNLLSQVLVASSYPLQVVQANQWLQEHPNLQGQELTTAAQQENWDPSVQALVVFPDVLKRLNEDIGWTTNLGQAFTADQGPVMDAVQRMRKKAQDTGKLNSTPQQKVLNTTDSGKPVVEIQPVNPQIVYVPVYDPVWVWGPAYYYPYPGWRYAYWPRSGVHFYFGPPVVWSVSFGWGGWWGWGWHPYWHNRYVGINHTFFTHYHYRPVPVRTYQGHSVWVHENHVRPAWHARPDVRHGVRADHDRNFGVHPVRENTPPSQSTPHQGQGRGNGQGRHQGWSGEHHSQGRGYGEKGEHTWSGGEHGGWGAGRFGR